MARKKVTLRYITNDTERKASFKKRKKGLFKKVSELSTLCGVDACAVVYSEYDSDPVVWPSRSVAQEVLSRFKALPEVDRNRKMVNQEGLTRQWIKKAENQLLLVQKENKWKELENFMFRCLAGTASMEEFDQRDAVEMDSVIENALKSVDSRMEELQRDHLE
ncbi:MADS box transcription factor [Handroanthus impetiginosus]|uniref:MADS box transcription factor n=1 Tax=Handroanthus impetiginosus TaxID=429701 RepID=A0A2G9I1L4_9LAMI|nr:MADS box transcription factor [Handroanthus impetiginosus]